MFNSFQFFSDSLNKTLDVEVFIFANEDEAWIEEMTIYDNEGLIVPESELPPDELRTINSEADALASSNASQAYQDRLESEGDFLYDAMKDNEMYDKAMEIMNEPDGYLISEDENN